jgi:hypothetical protein
VSWRDILTYIGVAIELAGAGYYLWTIPKGDTRPQPISWLGWTLIGIVGAWAARSGGAGLSFYIALSFVAVTASVFIASIIPGYGHSGTDKRELTDIPVLVAAIILLALRVMSVGTPAVHATLAVLGDSCFAWFTLRKAWRYPQTESLLGWSAAVLAGGLGLVVLGSFSYSAAVFPAYIFVGNAAIAGATFLGRQRLAGGRRKKSRG